MITRLITENFKRLDSVDITLDDRVIFIGPNNSGKTSALQAIALWETGVRTWLDKRGDDKKELKRSGVTVNRKDLISIPTPEAVMLWNNLHIRSSTRKNDKLQTKNILIKITVEGYEKKVPWKCGLEFDYANTESIYCRPLRLDDKGSNRMPLPAKNILAKIKVAFLPPMSGLASVEARIEPGRVNVLIGEGQTAQVLRNLCYMVFEKKEQDCWNSLVSQVKKLFGVTLLPPEYNPTRGEIQLHYREQGSTYDLSSTT